MTSPSSDSVAIATQVMHDLTGRRWTWPQRRTLEEYWVPRSVSRVSLSGRPVSAVKGVFNGVDGSPLQWELSDRFRLRLPQLEANWGWPFMYPQVDSNLSAFPLEWRYVLGYPVQVDYVYGSQPALPIRRAITQLATELDLAMAGADCALPERVTSVTREGVSWTVLDPQTFLEGGRTGLYYPDLVISMYNRQKARARTRVFSADKLPPRRLWSRLATPDDALDGGVVITGDGGVETIDGGGP